MDNAINIGYMTDDNFCKVTGISMFSCMENTNCRLHFYIYDTGVSKDNKELIDSMCENRAEVTWIDANRNEEVNKITSIYKYVGGFATLIRVFFDRFIPDDVNKLIFIDGDTLVTGNICELWEADLKGRCVGMATDCLRPAYKEYIGIDKSTPYYNSGVLLIDLKRYRENNLSERFMNMLNNRDVISHFSIMEQDLWNVGLVDEIQRIDLRFNLQTPFLIYSYEGARKVYQQNTDWCSKGEYEQSRNKAVIVHFNGNGFIRPWYSNSKHPYKKIYDSYYYRSIYRNSIQDRGRWYKQHLVIWILWRFFPEKLGVLIGCKMYDYFYSHYYKK